jgi:tetratricopeptide (TPR) repeat protein
VTIERVCNGSSKAQAYTDQKGHFSFQLGQTTGILQDASEDSTGMIYGRNTSYGNSPIPGANPNPSASTSAGVQTAGSATWRLANCQLRGVLAGFRSDTVDLTGRRPLDDPDVGTLILHRLGNVAGSVISVTTLEAPKNAQRAYEKGRHALDKGEAVDAIEHFQKAVDLFPRFAAAWFALGRMQENIHNVPEARKSYQAALTADPKFLNPYMPLASMAADERDWQQVAGITDRLLKLDPVDFVAAWFYNAAANFNLGHMDEAERSARTGQKLDTGHRYPKLEAVLGSVLVRRRDWAGAAEHLRSYLAVAPDDPDNSRLRRELARAEALAGPNQEAKAGAAGPPAGQSSQPDKP